MSLMKAIDEKALSIHKQRPNPDMAALNLRLWSMLASIAKARPELAAREFSLSPEVIQALGNASPAELSRVASGVIFGLMMITPEKNVLTMLASDLNHLPVIDDLDCNLAYWLVMQEMARKDLKTACVSFGVSVALASAVAGAEHDKLFRLPFPELALRFDPSLLAAILTPSLEPYNYNQLKMIQQSMACKPPTDACFQGVDTQDAAPLSRFGQRARARELALSGYVTRIIILETGLSDKQLRGLYSEIEEEGYVIEDRRTSRAVRGGSTLLPNNVAKLHASLLMLLYRTIGGASVLVSVSTPDIERAYRMYQAILCEVEAITPAMKNTRLTISDAWSLASELRSQDAFFEKCTNCGCTHFISVHQKTACDCPFCYVHSARKNEKTGKKRATSSKCVTLDEVAFSQGTKQTPRSAYLGQPAQEHPHPC